ncbi:hypothetical protein FACS1894205_6500 [Alphaproteobacteria bacterium]|nr:hypothetical protein FACS1894205_6500 [Alphaproteobacteria bacterium]
MPRKFFNEFNGLPPPASSDALAFPKRFFASLLLAAALPLPAFAGQTIIIDSPVGSDVSGNSDTPDGLGFAGLDPNGNSVIINADVNGWVDGAVHSDAVTGNSVTINGGVVQNGVDGGLASSPTGAATASGNSVSISGSPSFGGNAELHGGGGNGTGDFFTGNSLKILNYSGSAMDAVSNFQYYTFLLPADVANGDTALNVTNNVYLSSDGGLPSTISNVGFVGGGRVQQAGESFTLISAAGTLYGAIANDGQPLYRRSL